MEVSGQPHTPVALPQERSPWYPLDRRLGGPQSRSGRGGEERNSQPCQESNPNHSLTFYDLAILEVGPFQTMCFGQL
jgi:hypothetical protein